VEQNDFTLKLTTNKNNQNLSQNQ